MKLSSLFLCLCLFVACSANKLLTNSASINKISQQTVYFEDGSKSKLPIGSSKNATIIYLVRHAEKASTGGKDPLLTNIGTKRADRLKTILMDAGIDKVYSTEYKRTQLTAEPTAKTVNQTIQAYNPRDLKNFAAQLKKENRGQEILVVGHSNSTPTLVNELLGKEQFTMIDEKDYGHFFVVIMGDDGEMKGMDLTY